jgi:hypothetical protein
MRSDQSSSAAGGATPQKRFAEELSGRLGFAAGRLLGSTSHWDSRFLIASSSILAAALCLAASLGAGASDSPRSQTPQRTRIGEGEYVVHESENSGGAGPFGEEVYNFQESFTLWRDPSGGYQVEGTRSFESPKDESHSNPCVVELDRNLTLIRAKEFAKLRWVPDSGPLSCEFLQGEMDCSSGGSDPKREIKTRTVLENPYGLLWPVSPFSFGSIARQAERDPGKPTLVDLVRIEQPGMAHPVQTAVLEGPLQYLGEEVVQTAGRTWKAHKFSLKVAATPEFLIWTSAKGLLLVIAVRHAHLNWREEGMRLDRFESSADF